MIQSKIINELMDIYKRATVCYEYNLNSSFYKCLENQLVFAASKYNNGKDVLENYRIACQSYLDSKLLDFNISVCALLFSIASLITSLLASSVDKIYFVIIGIVIIICVICVVFFAINMHIKKRKLLEIYYVFEKMKD